MQRRFLTISLGFLVLGLSLAAQAASITAVGIEAAGHGGEKVVFTTDSPITPSKQFILSNPDRVVIDIPTARATGLVLPADYGGALIGNVRFGQYDPATSRLVIDLREPARLVHGGMEGNNRLAVDIEPLVPSPVGGGLGTGRAEAGLSPRSPSGPLPTSPRRGGEQRASPFAPVEPDKDNSQAPAPANPTKKPLIVIDAGHGGQDPGALGKHDTREKNVTLAMAKAVKAGLEASGRYTVKLTRSDDTYIPLQGRVDIARRAHADVFISLHADSNPKGDARGLSVYTLSENASDDEAQKLADRENKSDIIAGLDLDTADADVASILIDLTQRETMNKSALLADTVVKSLNPKINQLQGTHRFAGFRVLKAPDIPSVLIEMGFISNSVDEELLTSKEYQALFVDSLVKALDRYTAASK